MTRKSYPSDLTDLQWSNIEHLIPGPKPGGRPREYANRDLADAVFYLLTSGCSWRAIPHDFPPWDSVYGYYRRWQKDGTWQVVHDALRDDCRALEDRTEQPTAAILDSQSVKTTNRGGDRGYDAGKKNRRPQAAPAGRHDGPGPHGGGPRR
jgi:putative transposase